MGAVRTLDGGRLPIDLEHLSRYTAGRPETTRDLLIIFRDQAEKWISRMSARGDVAGWSDSAHTLKGAAKAIGAWPLAELCEEAETLVKPDSDFAGSGSEDGITARNELLARLRAEIERTRRYIDQVIEPLAG